MTRSQALNGNEDPLINQVPNIHSVLNTPTKPPFEPSTVITLYDSIVFGMGNFWSPEQLFWQIDGVKSTQVGYAGGYTINPTYEQVCTGRTGHAQVVRVIFDPSEVSLKSLICTFFNNHDPSLVYFKSVHHKIMSMTC